MNKYKNYIDIIEDSPSSDSDCTTGEKFTMDSNIVSIKCPETDDIYYMDVENLEHFKDCYTDHRLDVKYVENTIIDVVPFADEDCVGLAEKEGLIEL